MSLTQVYGEVMLDMKDTNWQKRTPDDIIAHSHTPSEDSRGLHSIIA